MKPNQQGGQTFEGSGEIDVVLAALHGAGQDHLDQLGGELSGRIRSAVDNFVDTDTDLSIRRQNSAGNPEDAAVFQAIAEAEKVQYELKHGTVFQPTLEVSADETKITIAALRKFASSDVHAPGPARKEWAGIILAQYDGEEAQGAGNDRRITLNYPWFLRG